MISPRHHVKLFFNSRNEGSEVYLMTWQSIKSAPVPRVGRDPRLSGPALSNAMFAAFVAKGCAGVVDMVRRCKLDPSLKATCFQPLKPESAYSAFNLNLVV